MPNFSKLIFFSGSFKHLEIIIYYIDPKLRAKTLIVKKATQELWAEYASIEYGLFLFRLPA